MITSRTNPRLKALRRARSGRGDAMVIEGPHLLADALAAGLEPRAVLATPAFLASPDGAAIAGRLERPPLAVSPALLDELADSDTPRGMVALVARRGYDLARLPRRPGGRYLLLDGVQDPGNLGALARVAEAAGAVALALAAGCARPDHPRALRASAGSLLRLPVASGVAVADLDRHLEDRPPALWAGLDPRAATSLDDAALDGTLVLALGAEGGGLSAAVAARLDLRLAIPMAGAVESLNVATAAAVTLFELARRDRQASERGTKRTAKRAGQSLPVK